MLWNALRQVSTAYASRKKMPVNLNISSATDRVVGIQGVFGMRDGKRNIPTSTATLRARLKKARKSNA
jgi:hypothetical protein